LRDRSAEGYLRVGLRQRARHGRSAYRRSPRTPRAIVRERPGGARLEIAYGPDLEPALEEVRHPDDPPVDFRFEPIRGSHKFRTSPLDLQWPDDPLLLYCPACQLGQTFQQVAYDDRRLAEPAIR